MSMNRPINNRLMPILAAGLVLAASAAQADSRAAYPPHGNPGLWRIDDRHGDDRDRRDWDRRDGDHGREWHPAAHRGPVVIVAPPGRTRHYRDVVVVRPHGHWYAGYGHYRDDDQAYKWLAFTAITLGVLDLMNESQERALEAAQIRATTAPVGQSIIWNDGGATGAVTTVREGTSTTGSYCREFQQKVTIGGKTEQAYGTACQQPDGAWQVVSTGF